MSPPPAITPMPPPSPLVTTQSPATALEHPGAGNTHNQGLIPSSMSPKTGITAHRLEGAPKLSPFPKSPQETSPHGQGVSR